VVLNRLLLLTYGVMFFGVVSSYDSYKENTLFVVGAAALITVGGLVAWIISIRGKS